MISSCLCTQLSLYLPKTKPNVPMESPQEKIERLRRELDEHNYNYYVLNAPTIDDRTFDEMMHELQGLEEAFPQYLDPNSPTQQCRERYKSIFFPSGTSLPDVVVEHTYSIEEVSAFYERVRSGLMGEVLNWWVN